MRRRLVVSERGICRYALHQSLLGCCVERACDKNHPLETAVAITTQVCFLCEEEGK